MCSLLMDVLNVPKCAPCSAICSCSALCSLLGDVLPVGQCAPWSTMCSLVDDVLLLQIGFVLFFRRSAPLCRCALFKSSFWALCTSKHIFLLTFLDDERLKSFSWRRMSEIFSTFVLFSSFFTFFLSLSLGV